MVGPWTLHEHSVVVDGGSMVVPSTVHGQSMVGHGRSVWRSTVDPWTVHEQSMDSPWLVNGSKVGPWLIHDRSIVGP